MGRTISQTVNFLGFLQGATSKVEGITTLCYELIQNADDVILVALGVSQMSGNGKMKGGGQTNGGR